MIRIVVGEQNHNQLINTIEMESVSCADAIGKNEKICFDCKTNKTPLWRSGPAGPKSLCNACGIRFRKKKSVDKKERQPPATPSASPSPASSTSDESTTCSRKREIIEDVGMDLRVKVVGMGFQRARSPMKKVKRVESEYMKNRKKVGEVEEAAYLLMCLSCG